MENLITLIYRYLPHLTNERGCFGGGGSSSTTTTVFPPPTAQELQAQQLAVDQTQLQTKILLEAKALSDPLAAMEVLGVYPDNPYEFLNKSGSEYQSIDSRALRDKLLAAAAEQKQTKELNDIVQKQLIGRLTGNITLTPAEQKLLDDLYASSFATGKENLQQFGNELANQRGLRPGDSPVGNELVREFGRLQLGLGSAKAASTLDLTQANKLFDESVREFQQGLSQQQFQNLIGLGAGFTSPLGLASALSSQRFAQPTTTMSQRNKPSFMESFGQVAGGLGTLALGVGAFGAPAMPFMMRR